MPVALDASVRCASCAGLVRGFLGLLTYFGGLTLVCRVSCPGIGLCRSRDGGSGFLSSSFLRWFQALGPLLLAFLDFAGASC